VRRGLSATRRRGAHGQSLVELALTLPLLLVLVGGSVEASRAFYQRESVTNAGRQALRVAVSSTEEHGVHPGQTACTARGAAYTGHAAGTAWLPSDGGAHKSDTFMTDIAQAAWLESSSDGTLTGSRLYDVANPSKLVVTWNCVNGLVVANSTAGTSDPAASCVSAATCAASISVTVTAHFSPIAVPSSIFPLSMLAFSTTERAEY
jgi:hypothetical protein